MECPDCKGKGRRVYYSTSRSGGLHGGETTSRSEGECTTCRGTGAVIKHVDSTPARKEERKCYTCSGTGKVTETVVTERYPSGKPAKTKDREIKCQRCGGRGKTTEKIEATRTERYEPDTKARKGGCFITSACMSALHDPNSDAILDAVRTFRDTYIIEQPYGRRLLDVYYEVAPEVVQAIDTAAAPDTYRRIFDTIITPCVALIRSGEVDDAVAHYARGFEALVAEFVPARLPEATFLLSQLGPPGGLDGSVCCSAEAGTVEVGPQDMGFHEYRRDHEVRGLIGELLPVDGTSLLLGNGADDVLFRLACVLRTMGHTDWRVAWPSYEPHVRLVAAAGGRVNELDTGPYGERAAQAMLGVEGHRGAILVVNPGNPTGVRLEPDELRHLALRNPDAYVVIDESFAWFSPGASTVGQVPNPVNLITIQSTSKSFGTPGIRLGWLTCTDNALSSAWNGCFPPFYPSTDQSRALLWMLRHRDAWRAVVGESARHARIIEATLNRASIQTSGSASNLVHFIVPTSIGKQISRAAARVGARIATSADSAEASTYFARLHAEKLMALRVYVVPGMSPQDFESILASAGLGSER